MLLVLLLIGVGAGTGVVSRGFAAEWPADRQFVLVAPPVQSVFASPPGSVAEAADGALLVLIFWPVIRTSKDGSTSAQVRSRLVRVAADGSLAFVPPFGDLAPGSRDPLVPDVDEIVPLPDGSILFSRLTRSTSAPRRIDPPLRRDRPLRTPPVTAARRRPPASAHQGAARFADGSILFGDNVGSGRSPPTG